MTSIIRTAIWTFFAFFAPVSMIILAVGLSIFADTIVALALTKQKFTSKRLRNGILSKTIAYESSILLLFLIDYAMINDAVLTVFSVPYVVTKIAGLFLIGIEVSSIDEKIRDRYGDDKGIISRFKAFVNGIKKIKDSF
jgi:hypothetical protein